MSTQDKLNMIPIQQFINAVKGADASKQRELRLDIDNAKRLAFTLGEVMTRMNGDLEAIIKKQKAQDDVIQVQFDGGNSF
tara:strand:+ start:1040 stop:1279 length:240 start_codon:yes stop_codon:yes gene_type:complete